jgi:branched-chain amino acid aminotransferase
MLQSFNPKNKDLIVNINGKLIHRDEAGVSPFDSAVQGGDAVWEGLRVYDGRIFKLNEHLDRLRSSATALAFTEIPSHESMIGEIQRTLEANKMRDGVHIRQQRSPLSPGLHGSEDSSCQSHSVNSCEDRGEQCRG